MRLEQKTVKTTSMQQLPQYQIPNLWNRLDDNVKMMTYAGFVGFIKNNAQDLTNQLSGFRYNFND